MDPLLEVQRELKRVIRRNICRALTSEQRADLINELKPALKLLNQVVEERKDGN